MSLLFPSKCFYFWYRPLPTKRNQQSRKLIPNNKWVGKGSTPSYEVSIHAPTVKITRLLASSKTTRRQLLQNLLANKSWYFSNCNTWRYGTIGTLDILEFHSQKCWNLLLIDNYKENKGRKNIITFTNQWHHQRSPS